MNFYSNHSTISLHLSGELSFRATSLAFRGAEEEGVAISFSKWGGSQAWGSQTRKRSILTHSCVHYWYEKQFSTFQTSIMAALIKKAPVLVNTALELAKPQLNTFLRYAKVLIQSHITKLFGKKVIWSTNYLKVELAPPSPGEIPAAIADISTKVTFKL